MSREQRYREMMNREFNRELSKPEIHHGFSMAQYLALFGYAAESDTAQNTKYRSAQDYVHIKAQHQRERNKFAGIDLHFVRQSLIYTQEKTVNLARNIAREGENFSLDDIRAKQDSVEELRAQLRRQAEYILSMRINKIIYLLKPMTALEVRKTGKELRSQYKTIMFGIDLCRRYLDNLDARGAMEHQIDGAAIEYPIAD